MTTIHDEARELYKRIARRHKTHPDPLDKEVLALLATVIPMIPEAKTKGLHPLHRVLITGVTPNFSESIPRPKGEISAFDKIASIVTDEDAEMIRAYMRKPAPRHGQFDDHLSTRPKSVQRVCNNYAAVRESAIAYFKKHPRTRPSPKVEIPAEPAGWQSRAPGALGEKTWDRVCVEYPDIAKQLANGEDLS